jgi:hypothetical protein
LSGLQEWAGYCTCGYNDVTYQGSHCDPHGGDAPGLKYYSAMKRWYSNGGMDVCNTGRRKSADCFYLSRNTTMFDQLVVESVNYNNYAKLVEIDRCVKATYMQYWIQQQKGMADVENK